MTDNITTPQHGTYAIIDGNSLMHRAFHGVSMAMTASDGTPTNAIFGFLQMFIKMVEDFKPDGVAVVFDKGRPLVRMEMLPQYKAQRPPRDPLLSAQFPVIREILEAMSVPTYAVEGWEGDDLLGTLARKGEAQGHQMLLVTGDRDSYQLATDNVRIIANKKGMTDVMVLGPSEVEELYEGVRPEQIPDFYGLKGDTSDNIPGVPGVGPKKAAALIVQYGDLEGIYAHAAELKGKLGENVRAHEDDAYVSRKVATIVCDAPISFDAAELAWPDFDPATLAAALDKYQMRSVKARFLALVQKAGMSSGAMGGAAPNLPATVEDGPGARAALDAAIAAGRPMGVWAETSAARETLFDLGDEGLALWVATSAGWDLGEVEGFATAAGAPVPLVGAASVEAAKVLAFHDQEALAALRDVMEAGLALSYDLKAELHRLAPVDSSQRGLLDLRGFGMGGCQDVGLMAYLLNSDRKDYDPAKLVGEYCPWEVPALVAEGDGKRKRGEAITYTPASIEARGICLAASLIPLATHMRRLLEVDGSLDAYQEVDLPLVPVLAILERNGMKVSVPELRRQSELLGQGIEELQEGIWTAAGERFNIDSPAQLSAVLFDTLQIPPYDPETNRPLKKTKTGFYTTNAKLLEGYAAQYPIVEDVLRYRERTKIRSTYLDSLPACVEGDGRVHTSYNMTVTATGRLSSSDPNLQNIPVRSDLGRMVRTAFVPADDDSVILAVDYSQIELRLLAHLSKDPGLVEAFCSGEDFHRMTAARVFGVDPADVTPTQRSHAKAVNFGIVYGQTAFGLASSLRIPNYQAQQMIDGYYATYPEVRRYLDEQVSFAHVHGYVSTMWGRKRRLPDINARIPNIRQFAERTAMNHPVQGSAADIIKLAMVRVKERMAAEGFKALCIAQVHDELDFDCPKAELDDLRSLVVESMQGVVELDVPLIAEASCGANWAEAK